MIAPSFSSFLTPPRPFVDYYWLFQVLVFRAFALGDTAFRPRAFELLRGNDETPSREYYLTNKDEFVAPIDYTEFINAYLAGC